MKQFDHTDLESWLAATSTGAGPVR